MKWFILKHGALPAILLNVLPFAYRWLIFLWIGIVLFHFGVHHHQLTATFGKRFFGVLIGSLTVCGWSVFTFTGDPEYPYFVWVFLLFFYPFLSALWQELYFREFMYQRIKRMSPLFRNGFISILFGVMHVPFGGISLAATAFASSLLIGWVRDESDSVMEAWIIHCVHGGIAFLWMPDFIQVVIA